MLPEPRTNQTGRQFPYRLVGRRTRGMLNSTVNDGLATRGLRHNPAYLNPADMTELRLTDGEIIEIRSAHGAIRGIVASDPSLRRGVVAMTHAFGGLVPATDAATLRSIGSNTAAVLTDEIDFDRFSGQPRMSNIPVALRLA